MTQLTYSIGILGLVVGVIISVLIPYGGGW